MQIVVVFDGDEAGEQAATRLPDDLLYWGRPRHPAEPDSQLVALLEREITRLSQLAEAHLAEPPDEGRDRRVAEAEADLELVIEYWQGERSHADSVTAYSHAASAEEYASLLAAAAAPVYRGPTINYKAIKEAIAIEDHIARYTPLRRSGKTYTGRCPLPGHEDERPSFTVYPDTRSFYCFGCHRGGDIFDFEAALGTNELVT